MLATSELEFDLPEGAIATAAAEPRDSAKMMVVSRAGLATRAHSSVRNLPEYLRAGDLLVLNTTRVLPARLEGQRADTGGRIGGLYLRTLGEGPGRRWVVMLKGKRLREGHVAAMQPVAPGEPVLEVVLLSRANEEAGAWEVSLGALGSKSDEALLDVYGRTPLPPYILKAREHRGDTYDEETDRNRYQTVFAAHRGSLAAPTAGMHLTPPLLDSLSDAGVGRADVVLHVGLGTFKPVETEFVEQHRMHREWCSMSRGVRDAIVRTRAAGGRVFCVGTTAARTVETYAGLVARGEACEQGDGAWPEVLETEILITPGYEWRWTDGLLTNFHLPRSTLLAMCGSLLKGGVPELKAHYRAALEAQYRFFSYGDAMLILP
ncbi:MAG: tRNA preQ1(34) S-adenosylmethionine ribosyltransferase-isomerase QueA [Phycisphaeraceae bacterium]|nr:tRNA preQ1(34) S-adenosylmethionine ribosyltransferase-isomerase QueA [Phycisphaeraceae bacterium]